MKTRYIIIAGLAVIIILIFGANLFDFSEKVPVIKAKFEIIEVDNETIIIDRSVEQSKTTYLKRPRSELQEYPLLTSHAAINGVYYSDWGITQYNGPGEYEIQMGFREGYYPVSNDYVMVISYLYDEEGNVILKDKIDYYWE
ncbi:MAG: hypothetical protein K0A89_04465 [ANME-2 cluster archaeon]|nr:hypothetical protein [ANME-2 cluster archaeon]